MSGDDILTISWDRKKVNIDLNQVNNAPFPKACLQVECNCNKETETTGKGVKNYEYGYNQKVH